MGRHIDAGREFAIADHRRERIPGADHIAELHRDIADHAGDGRTQIAEGQVRLTGLEVGGGLDVGLAQLIALQGTGGADPRQIGKALVVEPVLGLGRAQAHHLRLQLRLIQHHQQLARPHPISLPNAQLLDPATRLGRQLDSFKGIKGADRGHLLAEGGAAHRDRVNGQGPPSLRTGGTAARQQGHGTEGDRRQVAPNKHAQATTIALYTARDPDSRFDVNFCDHGAANRGAADRGGISPDSPGFQAAEVRSGGQQLRSE